MRSTVKRYAALPALLLFLTLPGCPGTDVVELDTGDFAVVVRSTNPGGSRWDGATFVVVQVKLRPLDPDANAALGIEPWGIINFPAPADINQSASALPAVKFHSGAYEVLSVQIGAISLFDDDPPIASPVCLENVVNPGPDTVLDTADDFAELPDPRFLGPGGVTTFPGRFTFQNFTADTEFTLPPAGGELSITIDYDEFIRVFEDSWTCVPAVNDTCFVGNDPVPSHACLTRFDQASFLAAGDDIFSFD